MSTPSSKARSASAAHRKAVAAYVAAGGEESVQRVITAIYGLTRKLDRWYTRQLSDLGLSPGEWNVLTHLATAQGEAVSPSQLAEASNVAASSMTHRLDKMEESGLVVREQDPENRTRVLVYLTGSGWDLFSQAVRESDVVESDTLSALSREQRTQLADLLEEVITRLDDLDPG